MHLFFIFSFIREIQRVWVSMAISCSTIIFFFFFIIREEVDVCKWKAYYDQPVEPIGYCVISIHFLTLCYCDQDFLYLIYNYNWNNIFLFIYFFFIEVNS